MKIFFLRVVLSGIMTFAVSLIYVIFQYVYQEKFPKSILIDLGFPYRFYYFTRNFEIHGFILIHFIYDSLLLFVCSFLVVYIVMRMRKKRKSLSENERVDELIEQNKPIDR